MNLPFEIFQGDSTPIVYVRQNIADVSEVISGDWSCKVALVGPNGNIFVAARTSTAKTSDNLHFAVQLSPAETDNVEVVSLPVRCKWIIQLDNNALYPPYSQERQIDVIVSKKGIA